MVKPHELLHKGSGIKAVFFLAPLPRRRCMGESPCSLGGGVNSSNQQFPRQTDRGNDTEGHHQNAEASRQAHTGTDSGGPLGVRLTQLGFQPGAFRISAGGTVTMTRYHRQNLYLGTGVDWSICKRMYTASMPLGTWSPPYGGLCPSWGQSVVP